jgi:hypothetical protein
MAEMTIRLRVNPQTGKKDIVVSLRSDEDSLPHEHEQQHRNLVDKLIEGGVLIEDEVGEVVVEREEESGESNAPISQPPQEQRQSQQEGS